MRIKCEECDGCGGFGMVARCESWAECTRCDGMGFYSAPASQSRRKSLLETITSTAIGFVVSVALTAVVLPAFGYRTTLAHDFYITAIFTVASVLRGYCVRRAFEAWR